MLSPYHGDPLLVVLYAIPVPRLPSRVVGLGQFRPVPPDLLPEIHQQSLGLLDPLFLSLLEPFGSVFGLTPLFLPVYAGLSSRACRCSPDSEAGPSVGRLDLARWRGRPWPAATRSAWLAGLL
jgi:hypothetical protein